MTSGWIIFIIAVGVVALFVLGLSLTQIFKGHPIDSEIGKNRHMQQLGIRCTASELMEEEHKNSDVTTLSSTDCTHCISKTTQTTDCHTCASPCTPLSAKD